MWDFDMAFPSWVDPVEDAEAFVQNKDNTINVIDSYGYGDEYAAATNRAMGEAIPN